MIYKKVKEKGKGKKKEDENSKNMEGNLHKMEVEERVYKMHKSRDYLAEGKGEQDEAGGRREREDKKTTRSESSKEIGFEGVVWLHVTQSTIE